MNKGIDEKQPGFTDLIKRAQEMQKKLQDMQKQMMETEITGQSGGGLVKITLTGHHYCRRVVIDNIDKEMGMGSVIQSTRFK